MQDAFGLSERPPKHVALDGRETAEYRDGSDEMARVVHCQDLDNLPSSATWN